MGRKGPRFAHEVPAREQVRHKLLSRYRAHGLLAAGGAGGTFARIADPPERRELFKELVGDGARRHSEGWPRAGMRCKR
jgi:hypothetical protein